MKRVATVKHYITKTSFQMTMKTYNKPRIDYIIKLYTKRALIKARDKIFRK